MLSVACAAVATTPAEWAAFDQEVAAACIAASGLRNARPAGKRVDFDDGVGYAALVIDGRYPQPHMKNRRARVLCLFDKRTRAAIVADGDALIGSHAR
jgi:hypothetical protein